MNILITNDDGVDSEGLKKLAALLRAVDSYKVTVVAPAENRSGVSHALSFLNEPLLLKNLGQDTWSCSGTPADCVIAAVKGGFCVKPDLVLSGINQGANLGTDIIFSGTAAAARQASLIGVPSIALSLKGAGPYHWDMAVSWIVEHLEELVSYWREHCFVNVNIPNRLEGPLGILMAWPAIKHYRDSLSVKEAEGGNLVCTMEWGSELALNEAGSDIDAVARNYVSISTTCNLPVVLKELCPQAPSYAAVTAR